MKLTMAAEYEASFPHARIGIYSPMPKAMETHNVRSEVTEVHDDSKGREQPRLEPAGQLIDRLREQKQLISEPSSVRTIQRWVLKDGEKVPIERRIEIHPFVGITAFARCGIDVHKSRYTHSILASLASMT